ncbi:MAG: universal stress protein [Solirubrobacterales bacterium]|nr:universal stress protein [Solirubrobacterales bacterium]
MPSIKDRSSLVTPSAPIAGASGPVVLATLALRPDPTAEQMAIDSCLDAGAPLILVNAVQLPMYPTTMLVLGPAATVLPHEDDRVAVSEAADRIAALGIPVELVGLFSPRPVQAVLKLLTQRNAALLVFGPLLSEVGRLRMRTATRRLRRDASCLVWVAPDG